MGRAFEFRKARKFKRWAAMAKTFTRIGKDIVMAVKEGGPHPESNSRLRAVIQNAKAANMPKENIERAIKKATEKDTANYKEVLFEGYAPHGIAVLIETATDNNNRTVANIRSYFNKCNGTLGTSGSVEFMFDHTCNFRINGNGIDPEELELEMIDFGAEEVFVDEDGILIYAPFESFGAIQKELESRNIEILSSGFERIPQVTKELTPEEQADVEKRLFIPDSFFEGSLEEFWENLPTLDSDFERQSQQLAKEDKRWRFVATMDHGKTCVGLQAVDKSHPFYNLEGSNNIVLLTTERYKQYPMQIQGYGAGADVTAAGVFANIMSIANI